jgi:CDP-glucose 4,6-dehydratase
LEDLVNPSRSFWDGRRVLISGHTGFKGAWLWLLLRALGARPIGIALPAGTDPNLSVLAGISRDSDSHFLDIRDGAAVARALKDANPEIVIHLAAQSLVRRSYDHPVETFSTNLMGTIQILEAIRSSSSVRSSVIATSDKVYRNRNHPGGYREIDELGGHDPYSSSKACSEFAVESWRLSFFSTQGPQIGLATVRAGNVIGGGDWSTDRLVPDLVRAFANRRPADIRKPDAIRSWIHVLEPLTGYLILAERLFAEPKAFSEAWNFGPADSEVRSVKAVCDRAAKIWADGAAWRAALGSHPHEAAELRLDAAKARRRLRWRPRLDFDTALSWTIDWYRQWHAGADAVALCRAQIERYLGRAD